jgi:hypothetical protein
LVITHRWYGKARLRLVAGQPAMIKKPFFPVATPIQGTTLDRSHIKKVSFLLM